MLTTLTNRLWGKQARLSHLLAAAVVLLLGSLGTHDLWTQEHRWADIVSQMFYTGDFLHPWLNGQPYYDKPLLSYWLISGFAIFFGKLSTWSLRLPSAIAGIIAVYAIYALGRRLKNRELGLLSGWMLLTTWYFLFWARTSSADMLNMAGTLAAVSWYFAVKSKPRFINYFIFYLIIVLTALCKGLIAPVVVFLVIAPDFLTNNEWRRHLRPSLFLAAIPAILLYLLPFWASAHTGGDTYQQNGLSLVWRENVLRYFQPFDHKGPIYTYFIYLPVYLLPWTVFFIPALASFRKRLMNWSILLLFLFLTLSGSRRNYYILPVVPFALLMTADWIQANGRAALRYRLAGGVAITAFVGFFMLFVVIQPYYYKTGSLDAFAAAVRQDAEKRHPWSEWQVVLLDPQSKLRFYLGLRPDTPLHEIGGGDRASMTEAGLRKAWGPVLSDRYARPTLYISRTAWTTPLSKLLGPKYHIVENKHIWQSQTDTNQAVAFIPDK